MCDNRFTLSISFLVSSKKTVFGEVRSQKVPQATEIVVIIVMCLFLLLSNILLLNLLIAAFR